MSYFDPPPMLAYRNSHRGKRDEETVPGISGGLQITTLILIEVLALCIFCGQVESWLTSTTTSVVEGWPLVSLLMIFSALVIAMIVWRGRRRYFWRQLLVGALPALCIIMLTADITDLIGGRTIELGNLTIDGILGFLPMAVLVALLLYARIVPRWKIAQYLLVNLLPVLAIVAVCSFIAGWLEVNSGGGGGAPEIIIVGLIPVCGLMGILFYAHLMAALGRRRMQTLIVFLEQATRLNLPLPPIIEALSADVGFTMYRRLQALRVSLLDGESLDVALRETMPDLSMATVASVGAALQVGQLPRQLSRLREERSVSDAMAPVELPSFYQTYLFAFMAIAVGVVGLVLVTAMGRLQLVMAFSKQPLPLVSASLIGFWQSYLPFIQLLVIFLFYFTRWPWRLVNIVIWYTPIAGRFVRNRGYYELCDFLSGALETDTPLPRALRMTALAQGNDVLRRRVARWADGVELGRDTADAARDAHLPRTIVGFAASSHGVRTLLESMQFLTAFYDGAYRRTQAFWRQACVPILVAIMGVIALTILSSVMLPWITYINVMADKVGVW